MESAFQALWIKHRASGILVDTNLLLLLAVGGYDSRRVLSFKRTSHFTLKDFELLKKTTTLFSKLWTTPNILTEVDNLGRQLRQNEWDAFANALRALAVNMMEFVVPSAQVVRDARFVKIGLSDTTTVLVPGKPLLLTDDLKLHAFAQSAGFDAINFNHLRMYEI